MSSYKNSSIKALVVAENIGLSIIAIATIIAIGLEVQIMIRAMNVTLVDLLLLFIYIEVLSMVGSYIKSGKLPVRMPLYIAIVAVARYLVLDMKNLDTWRMVGLAAGVLILALAILTIRYGHTKYPYKSSEEET